MNTNIKFNLEAGLINNQSMKIEIVSGKDSLCLENLPQGHSVHSISVTFPDRLIITVSGKGKRDTVVDKYGNILKDKFIRLAGLSIDNMKADNNWLKKFLILKTIDGNEIHSNYFGFNGTVELDLSPTPFQWLASTYSH